MLLRHQTRARIFICLSLLLWANKPLLVFLFGSTYVVVFPPNPQQPSIDLFFSPNRLCLSSASASLLICPQSSHGFYRSAGSLQSLPSVSFSSLQRPMWKKGRSIIHFIMSAAVAMISKMSRDREAYFNFLPISWKKYWSNQLKSK